jgi:hypothetical protein
MRSCAIAAVSNRFKAYRATTQQHIIAVYFQVIKCTQGVRKLPLDTKTYYILRTYRSELDSWSSCGAGLNRLGVVHQLSRCNN